MSKSETEYSRSEYHRAKKGRTQFRISFDVHAGSDETSFSDIEMSQSNKRDVFRFNSLEEFDEFVDFAGEVLEFATKIIKQPSPEHFPDQ